MTLEQIAALPFIRPGEKSLDCAWVVNIWDARQRLALNKLIAIDPHSPHDSPDGLMHYIPNAPAEKLK